MPSEQVWRQRRLHFVGVGGCGMSGLAAIAHTLAATVSGSDRAETAFTARLGRRGISLSIGHDERNVPSSPQAELVYSSAIPDDKASADLRFCLADLVDRMLIWAALDQPRLPRVLARG